MINRVKSYEKRRMIYCLNSDNSSVSQWWKPSQDQDPLHQFPCNKSVTSLRQQKSVVSVVLQM